LIYGSQSLSWIVVETLANDLAVAPFLICQFVKLDLPTVAIGVSRYPVDGRPIPIHHKRRNPFDVNVRHSREHFSFIFEQSCQTHTRRFEILLHRRVFSIESLNRLDVEPGYAGSSRIVRAPVGAISQTSLTMVASTRA